MERKSYFSRMPLAVDAAKITSQPSATSTNGDSLNSRRKSTLGKNSPTHSAAPTTTSARPMVSVPTRRTGRAGSYTGISEGGVSKAAGSCGESGASCTAETRFSFSAIASVPLERGVIIPGCILVPGRTLYQIQPQQDNEHGDHKGWNAVHDIAQPD